MILTVGMQEIRLKKEPVRLRIRTGIKNWQHIFLVSFSFENFLNVVDKTPNQLKKPSEGFLR
jgi:hypothetical protein